MATGSIVRPANKIAGFKLQKNIKKKKNNYNNINAYETSIAARVNIIKFRERKKNQSKTRPNEAFRRIHTPSERILYFSNRNPPGLVWFNVFFRNRLRYKKKSNIFFEHEIVCIKKKTKKNNE